MGREPRLQHCRGRHGLQFAETEVPLAKPAGQLCEGEVGGLFEVFAGALRGEVTVLFHQPPREPDLPDRQADDDCQEERQAPAHRQQPGCERAHCGFEYTPPIVRCGSGICQGCVRDVGVRDRERTAATGEAARSIRLSEESGSNVIFNILGNQLRQITVASWRARRIYVYVVEKKNRVR